MKKTHEVKSNFNYNIDVDIAKILCGIALIIHAAQWL